MVKAENPDAVVAQEPQGKTNNNCNLVTDTTISLIINYVLYFGSQFSYCVITKIISL